MNRPLKVLVVEDSPTVALNFKMLLERDELIGMDIVGTLAEALVKVGTERYDVVLLDLNLPDASGVEAQIQMKIAAPLLPVVVITGASDDIRETVIAAGAADFLTKPPESGAVLVAALRRAAARKDAEAQVAKVEESLASTTVALEKCEQIEHAKAAHDSGILRVHDRS